MIRPTGPLTAAEIGWMEREIEAWHWSIRTGKLRLADLDSEPKAYLNNKSVRELVYKRIVDMNVPVQ